MARLTLPTAAEMTPDQRVVCEEVVAGVRGKVPAPMIAWMRNPELARRGQRLGELLRYETSLPPALSELAILTCARHWTAHMAWVAHKREGLKAGLSPDIIAAIAARRRPDFCDDHQACIYELSSSLLSTGRIPPETYGQGVAKLGETMLVELVAILGYYSLACMTLNSFELGLPENLTPELSEA